MKKITKGSPPDVLARHSQDWIDEQMRLARILSNNQDIVSDDFKLYKRVNLKRKLEDEFSHNCCYCGSKIPKDVSYGHIEHYRPKTAISIKRGGDKQKPAYYWLGASWENLLLVCPVCNSNKGDKFPLLDDSFRDIRNKNIANEVPLILNITDNRYRFENNYVLDVGIDENNEIMSSIVLKGISLAGVTTISYCNLMREELFIKREKVRTIVVEDCHLFEEFLSDCRLPLTDENLTRRKRALKRASGFVEKYFGESNKELEHKSLTNAILMKMMETDTEQINKFKSILENESIKIDSFSD